MDYEGRILTQTDGAPIGKSFSGCICGIFMADFEKKNILHNPNLPSNHHFGNAMKMMFTVSGNIASEEQRHF